MITSRDKELIREIARRYGACRVLLFGSSLSEAAEGSDIDIAVEGVPDEDYYAFYGELMRALSKPVDVVDLTQRSKFTELVVREGVELYG